MKEFLWVGLGFILGSAIGVHGLIDIFNKVLKLFSF
jgi:hypothetical protein